MAKTLWGRSARLYVAAVTYTDGVPDLLDPGDLVEVVNLKDITTNDSARVLVATARDLEYDVAEQGAKELSIECEKLINVDQSGDDVTALLAAYDDGSQLWVLVTPKAQGTAAGQGVLLLADLFGWPEDLPEEGAGFYRLMFKPHDPDAGFQRVVTPFEQHVYEIDEGGASGGTYDVALAGYGTVTLTIGDSVAVRQAAVQTGWVLSAGQVRVATIVDGISITITGLGDPAMTIDDDSTTGGTGVSIAEA